jgi:hypothetical protein
LACAHDRVSGDSLSKRSVNFYLKPCKKATLAAPIRSSYIYYSGDCREGAFSETRMQPVASLFVRTGVVGEVRAISPSSNALPDF